MGGPGPRVKLWSIVKGRTGEGEGKSSRVEQATKFASHVCYNMIRKVEVFQTPIVHRSSSSFHHHPPSFDTLTSLSFFLYRPSF